MGTEKKKQMGVLGLVVALVVTLFGSLLFVGAAGGWFDDKKVILEPEYYSEGAEFMELAADEYEKLVETKKSFVVFVDQDGCTTADRLREYVTRYMADMGISVYRMMFAEMKESSLHEAVKYYPSVVVVFRGKVVGFLRADVDEDARFYNNYEDFREWMGRYLY